MNLVSMILLGLAMSSDAFAAALGKGAGMLKPRLGEALRVGLIFGTVEAITPTIGWLIGAAASSLITKLDHWVAFALLLFLGLHMIYKAVRGRTDSAAEHRENGNLLSVSLAGLATSMDAMAVGVGLAFVKVNILLVAAIIGLCTWTMVTIGVMAGRALGAIFGKRAEALGGLVLIGVGATILYEHLRTAPL